MKLLTAYFVASFYVLGALFIENEVNYVTWYQIDAVSFRAYHQALESRLQIFLFTPMAVQLLMSGLLIRQNPAYLPRWPFVVTFVLMAYIIGESLLMQVPIHQALAERYSERLVDQLLSYHRTWRLPAEMVWSSLTGWLLHRALRDAQWAQTKEIQ